MKHDVPLPSQPPPQKADSLSSDNSGQVFKKRSFFFRFFFYIYLISCVFVCYFISSADTDTNVQRCLCFRTPVSPLLHCLQLSFSISVWVLCVHTAMQSHFLLWAPAGRFAMLNMNNKIALSTYKDIGIHQNKNEGNSKCLMTCLKNKFQKKLEY